jgi:hypothetical protein
MKKGRTITRYILLLSLICIFTGIAAAEPAFSSGDYFSTITSASLSSSTSTYVQGTVEETVTFTKTTMSGEIQKTEFTNSFASENPIGLSWRSSLSVNSDKESAWVDYSRSGSLPTISWSSGADSSARSEVSPRFSRAR